MTAALWKTCCGSTVIEACTYIRTARGRPASRCASSPPKRSAPRHHLRRAAVNGMDPSADREWALLLAEWQRQTDEFRDSVGRKAYHRRAAMTWWGTTAKIIRETQAKLVHGERLQPSPDDVLKALVGISEYLAAGIVPGPVEAVRGRGKPPIGPTEARDLSWATAYMRLCMEGAIDDPSYVATVCRHFDVARQTAQSWKIRDIVPAVTMHMSDPQFVATAMQNAGSFYRASQGRRKLGKVPV